MTQQPTTLAEQINAVQKAMGTLSLAVSNLALGVAVDDSSLAPPEVASVCAFPPWPVLSVKTFGAVGDGKTDDTMAIKRAIATASGGTGTIIYFPIGIYAVCNQAPGNGPIFDLSGESNLAFVGDHTGLSSLVGYMQGLANPVTTWSVIGGPTDYFKIGRFSMFQAFGNVSNIQFRSLTIDGQCPATGDGTVGGIIATGDGWDMTNKCLWFDKGTIDQVLVFNCTLQNWRGEIVYAGGNLVNRVNVVSSTIKGCNASAICSGSVTVYGSKVGGPTPPERVFNGFECFGMQAPQQVTIQHTEVQNAFGNGIVYIGNAPCPLLVEDSNIHDCPHGLLLSTSGTNLIVRRNTFKNASITDTAGTFAGVSITDNTLDNSPLISQAGMAGLVLSRNTALNGPLSQNSYIRSDAVIDANILGSLGVDSASDYPDQRGLWTNTQRSDTSPTSDSIGYRVDFFGQVTVPVEIRPATDCTLLRANQQVGPLPVTINPVGYPVGFVTTFRIGQPNWVLQKGAWNTFAADVPVTDGLKIRVNAQQLFELA